MTELKTELSVTRDKHGREIKVGDVLKVYHFTAALRREKRYMYKYIPGVELLGGLNGRPKVLYFRAQHLDERGEGYWIGRNEGVLEDYEIVQGWDEFRDRPKAREGQ